MSLLSDTWYQRNSDADRMSGNLFALAVTGFTAAGIIFATLMARVSLHWHFKPEWTFWVFAGGVLVVSLVGVVISNWGKNHPIISLIGYALVAGPFGLLVGPLVSHYTQASVVKIFAITTLLVLVLGAIGAVIPESLESWGAWLMGGLVALLVGYFAVPLFAFFGLPFRSALTTLDWIGIIVFSGLVIFDLNRAMRQPRTLTNAIQASLAVFLDFFNLFIRLLDLMGESSDDD